MEGKPPSCSDQRDLNAPDVVIVDAIKDRVNYKDEDKMSNSIFFSLGVGVLYGQIIIWKVKPKSACRRTPPHGCA